MRDTRGEGRGRALQGWAADEQHMRVPRAAVTKRHKLGGREQQGRAALCFRRPEVQDRGVDRVADPPSEGSSGCWDPHAGKAECPGT